MAADPRLDLTPSFMHLESLQKEVTYAGRYRNADPMAPSIPTQPTSYAHRQTAASSGGSTNQQWVAPYQQVTAPAPQMPAQMAAQAPVSTPTQYSSQAPQAPQQQDNPYKEAFNRVVGLLSSPVQFPNLAQQSSQTQGIDPASYGSQQTTQFNNLGRRPLRLGSTTTRHFPATLPKLPGNYPGPAPGKRSKRGKS